MSDRVAFLDVDGTLRVGGNRDFTPEAIIALRALRNAGYRFVLHSTQRVDAFFEMCDTFTRHGLTLLACTSLTEPSKAKAIRDWLDDNYGRETWPATVLVLDDDPLFMPDVTHVRPDFRVGLTLADLPPPPADRTRGEA